MSSPSNSSADSAPAAGVPAKPSGSAGVPDFGTRIDSALGAAGKILRAYKFDDAAALAEAKVRSTEQQRRVVVVGEVKRGKSALVNALVGLRDATPVDVDVTTSASVHLVAATAEHPAGSAELLFPDRSERVAAQTLPDWVTVAG